MFHGIHFLKKRDTKNMSLNHIFLFFFCTLCVNVNVNSGSYKIFMVVIFYDKSLFTTYPIIYNPQFSKNKKKIKTKKIKMFPTNFFFFLIFFSEVSSKSKKKKCGLGTDFFFFFFGFLNFVVLLYQWH